MFDIDKFFLSRLYINSNGGTDFKENTYEWHANRLINAYLAVLKDSPNSFQDLNGSIDNDTSLLTDVRDDLREGLKNKALIPYSAYTLRSQSATKNVFIAGKFGISPFALNNNMHILMLLYGVKFAFGNNIMSDLGLTNLGGFTDRYGQSILSWFSGLINAHVDAAKDPWIPELNVNKYTYNLVSVLMHSGLGKDTFYFTTLPLMKQLAIAYENASGVYMSDQSKSKTKAQQEAEEEVIKNMIDAHWNKQLLEDGVATENTFSFSSYNAAVKAYWKTKGYSPRDAIKALFEKDCQVLRQVAKKHIGEPGSPFLSVEDDQASYWLTINGEECNLTAFDVQMIVAAANSRLKPYAKALSKLVQHTKIDTKKQGKNLIEQRKYLQGVYDLFDSTYMSEDRLLFDTDTLDRLYTDSYILHQTKVATGLFRGIMANQMIEATDKFANDVDRLLKTVGNPGNDPKVLNTVQNGIMAKIRSGYFFGPDGYCERHGIDPRSLVAGKATIYDKLLSVKAMLLNDPKYKDLIDKRSGEPSNYLLRALVSGNKYRRFNEKVAYNVGTRPDTFMDAKFIQSLDFVIDDAFNADDLSQAWDDLLQDSKYPELQQFARELVVYAFITSGDNGGRQNLFKYVPNTWRLGQTEEGKSYADYMAEQHQKYVDGVDVLSEDDFEDIILNNWYDDSIVPKYFMYRKNFKLFESWDTQKSSSGLPVVMGAVDKKGQPTIKNPKAYIKVPRYNGGVEVKGQRGYVVYKRIGYGISKSNQPYPVYAMVDPRGELFDKNEKILQHWQEDYSETRNIVEKYLGQILKAAELLATTVEDAITKIADYILANKLDLQTIVEGGLLDEDLSYIIKDINRTSSTVAQNDQPLPVQTVNFYEGMIVPDGNTVFVFGSNPGGVHGAGAAKTARDMFGALTGVGEGMTGNAYALPTKDLEASKGTEWYKPGEEQRDKILQYYKQRLSGVMFDPSNISYLEVVDNPIKRTISPEKIVESIKRMYEVARQNPEKQFKVAYGNGLTEITYNGYIGAEMIEMFKEAGPIPSNVYFSRAWVSSGMFDQTIIQPETKTPGTYDVPQQSIEIWYGSSDNDPSRSNPDLSNFAERPFKIKGSVIGAPGSNEEYEFKSVERAFQAAKVFYTDMMAEEKDQWFKSILNADTSAKAKQLGGEVPKLDVADWNTYKYEILKDLIKASFEQNETARNRLLSTGNAKLTHTRGGKEYSREFPRILTEVRDELRALQNDEQEERKPRLIKKGNTEYENVYQNMTDSEYEEWKNKQLNSGYLLTDQFIQQIKDHIRTDKYSNSVYNVDRIRQSLIKLTDALFEYIKNNGIKVEFIRASKDNKAGGESMIYPNSTGDGYIIEVNANSDNVYLDILHELLHAVTNPFDNLVVKEFGGMEELPQQLLIYYEAFVKKVFSQKKYSDARSVIQQFINHQISREELEKQVDKNVLEVMHAVESPGEFLSSFISSEAVKRETESIVYADSSLFEEFISYIKDFLLKLFKGYSYVDSADVLDDITDFLVNYDGKYKTPAQIVAPFVGGKTILDSGEVLYTTNDIKTNIIPGTALQRYSSSKDLLKSILDEFNADNPIALMLKSSYGSVDKKTKLFLHKKNRWVVLGAHDQRFEQDGKYVSGVQYARQNISNWLIEKQLPSDFIYITDGGLVIINPRYIINSYLSRGSLIIGGDVPEPVSPFGEDRVGALHEQRWILTNQLREVENKKQVVQKLFISPIEHDPFVINTSAGKLRGINGFIDNGESIFGLVSMRINISENVVTSPFIFPTKHLFDNKYNFARLDNSVKSNYFTIAYNILNYLELNGFKSVESGWYRGKKEKNEGIENLKKMFGNDVENLINIQEDLREEYSPVFGKITVPYYKFVINISKFSNLIASNHDVNVDNDIIQLVKSAISKLYDRSKEDISIGREALEKLNASADAIRLQISELDDEIRKELLVYLSNLGKKQEDKCNGGFEELPF